MFVFPSQWPAVVAALALWAVVMLYLRLAALATWQRVQRNGLGGLWLLVAALLPLGCVAVTLVQLSGVR
jgi:predicted Abi (CAAX) family protease